MGAFRAKPCAIALLAAVAACGRLGYEQVQIAETHDAAVPPRDVGAPIDQQVPADTGSVAPTDLPPESAGIPSEVRPPDTLDASALPEAPRPDTSDAPPPPPPDAMPPPPDMIEAPRDAAADAPTFKTVVPSGQNATIRRGGSGQGVVDQCPAGQLLVGFEGTQSSNQSAPAVQSIAGICATVTLPVFGAPAPPPWSLTRLPARGNTSGDEWIRLCPDRHVLVGFDGNARNVIGQIVFVCAPIGYGSTADMVAMGTDIELDDVGGPRLDDFTQVDCPAGQAARGAEIRVGSVLELFGLFCTTSLSLR